MKRATPEARDGTPVALVAHIFPTFAVGGSQVRFAAVANHFGAAFRHVVVALDGDHSIFLVEDCRSLRHTLIGCPRSSWDALLLWLYLGLCLERKRLRYSLYSAMTRARVTTRAGLQIATL